MQNCAHSSPCASRSPTAADGRRWFPAWEHVNQIPAAFLTRSGNRRSDAAMPHFTIEYSANLEARVDMAEVVEIVRKAAVETGIFPLGGIRVRAIKCEHYAIADGREDLGFLDMVLRLGEGR